ncbi:PfkB family carbohydrate kinase [Nocardia sp. NPDC056000]|uniref:PfkB family carbohydrate kinase n=1 Tax=Nocardia sp. NPDC056000 TaxID=3345674 RepID=UPI0035DC8B50
MPSALFVGLTTVDLAYGLESYPHEDSKTVAVDQFLGAGGPAANAAVAYALLSGESPELVTGLGTHPLADVARNDLVEHGVTVIDATPGSRHQPPVSSILVARKAQSRTIVSLDASRISASFDNRLAAGVATAKVVLVDGHYPELALGIAREANRAGVPVILDAGRWKESHLSILPLVDAAIVSSAFEPPDLHTDAASDIAEYVRSFGPKQVAITCGADPIRYFRGAHSAEIAVHNAGAIDTLGAGDIFHGAYCYYSAQGYDFAEALECAAKIATLSCQYFGTRQWGTVFTKDPR